MKTEGKAPGAEGGSAAKFRRTGRDIWEEKYNSDERWGLEVCS